MSDNEVMTIEEVADFLRIGPRTVMKMANSGELPAKKFANRWRFRRSDVEEFMNTAKIDKPDNCQNHQSEEPMPLANVIDAPSDLVGVTVICEEDGQGLQSTSLQGIDNP
jgi:excisionase family DNA binding protein